MQYPHFNPDPDMEADAERYAAECEARDQAHADMIEDALDLARYDDLFDSLPPWDEPEDESWRDEPEQEW